MVYVTPQAPLTSGQLFNSFVPKVEITKVVLSYKDQGGGLARNVAEQLFDNNPHIDVADQGDRTARDQFITDREEALLTRITVDLAIKIPRGQFAFSSAFDQEDIRASLEIQVGIINFVEAFDKVAYGDERLSNSDIRQYVIESDPFPFAEFNKKQSTIREMGQTFDLYTHQIEFEPQANFDLSSFGIVALAMINPAAITMPNWLPDPATMALTVTPNIFGIVDSLWVIENDLTVSTTRAFVISDDPHAGEVWNGMVHQEPDGFWYTGSTSNRSTQKKLSRILTQVPKVQDFRIVNKIGTLPLDFSITDNEIFPHLKKDLRRNRIDINSACTSFSDVFLSRDIINNCRFFFSINQKKIMLENSIFGGLFANASEAELRELLDNVTIKSLKVWRYRIEGSSEIGSKPYKKIRNASGFQPACKPHVFDENQIPELIAESSDDEFGQLIASVYTPPNFLPPRPYTSPSKTKGGGSPLPSPSPSPSGISLISTGLGGMPEIAPSPASTSTPTFETRFEGFIEEPSELSDSISLISPFRFFGLRHFSGFDGFIKAETDGYYKYEVEIDMLDKTVERIIWKLEGEPNDPNGYPGLLGFIKQIKLYYEDAIRQRRSSGVPPWMSPYIDNPQEHPFEPGELHENYGGFNAQTNRFTQEFIIRWTESGGGTSRSLSNLLRRTIISDVGDEVRRPGFVQILEFFSKDWSTALQTQIQNALLDYLNPYTATPESINVVLQLMETVASKIESVLGVVYKRHQGSVDASGNQGEVKKRHTAAKNRVFKVRHKSVSFFNANLKSNLGFDFLNTTNLNYPWHSIPQGLYKISTGQLRLEAEREHRKFLTDDSYVYPPIHDGSNVPVYPELVNSNEPWGTYFTPHVIITPNQRTLLTDGQPDGNDFLHVLAYSLCERESQDEQQLTDFLDSWISALGGTMGVIPPNLLASDLAAYLALYHNVTLYSPENVLLWRTRAQSINEGNTPNDTQNLVFYHTQRKNEQVERAAAYKFFMKIVGFLEFDEIQKKNIPGWHLSFDVNNYDLGGNRSGRGPSPLTEQFALEPNHSARVQLLRDAPPSIKALIWKASDPWQSIQPPPWASMFNEAISPTNVPISDTQSSPLTQYTTQIINRVEVLIGYERQPIITNESTGEAMGGEILLNKPLWSPMGNSFGRSGVCRSVPHESEKYLLRREKNYNLPTYDEYFIMTE